MRPVTHVRWLDAQHYESVVVIVDDDVAPHDVDVDPARALQVLAHGARRRRRASAIHGSLALVRG